MATHPGPYLAKDAALERIEDPEKPGPGKALLTDLILWELAAAPLVVDDYQAAYASGGAGFYLQALKDAVCFYQQLHAVVAGAVVLIAAGATPPIKNVEGLAQLEQALSEHPDQDLGSRAGAVRRELRLLRWLVRVRNKAIQHRAGNEHYSSDGIVLRDGLAFIRRRGSVPDEPLNAARAQLQRLIAKYRLQLDASGTTEVFAYVDLISHSLYGVEDEEFDESRDVVEPARLHQVVISPPLIENADACLAKLVALAPPAHARRPT